MSVWWVQSSKQVYPAEGGGICALSIPVMIVRTIKILCVVGKFFPSIFNDKLNFIRHVDRSPNSFSYLIRKRNCIDLTYILRNVIVSEIDRK